MTTELYVHLDGVFVGQYSRDRNGRTFFEYDPEYRNTPNATPLSLALPLEATSFSSKAVRGYFAGLVPESEGALDQIRIKYNLRGNPDEFTLLQYIGRDAPGAVQVLPADEEAADAATRRGDVTRLSNTDFTDLVTDLAGSPEDWDAKALQGKWSLPGAQRKVALFRFSDGTWGIPRDSTPTTHILKPAIAGFANHDVNEYLSLHAARWLGMTIAPTAIEPVGDDVSVLVSTRYDRLETDGRWRRLHQEDMCQALSVMPRRKYQSDGGPGVAQIADLLSQFPSTNERESSRTRFFDALVFNVATWATDAHAKNFSVLLVGNQQTLAPLYDIASHAPYPPGRVPDASAMKIGDEYSLARIGKRHLLKAAARLRVDKDWAGDRIDHIRSHVVEAYAHAASELDGAPGFLRSAAARIVDSIGQKSMERGLD